MMSKDDFLNGLRARISVLDSGEQEDILGEYAQHIDIRVAEGLTEEQAIQDFGNMDQLAAEILGAYHVDPTYAEKAAKKVNTEAAIKEKTASAEAAIKSAGKQAAGVFSKAWSTVWGFLCRCGRCIRDGFENVKCRIKSLFTRENDGKNKRKQKMNQEEGTRTFASALKNGFRALWRAILACLRVCWNCALLCCALPVVLMVIFGLIVLGTMGVLMVQGYPLLGVLLAGIGAVICCIALLGLGSQLIWHKPRAVTPFAEDFSDDDLALPESGEEADYE